MAGGVQKYLTSGEEISHEWEGTISDGEKSGSDGVLVATDRRLAYLADGSFKDIDYGHISSIESDTNEVLDVPWLDVLNGLMFFFGMAGILSWLMEGEMAALGIGPALLVIAYLLYQTRSDEDREPQTIVKQSLTIVTDDVRENEINFETTENIGADLSKTIRNKTS